MPCKARTEIGSFLRAWDVLFGVANCELALHKLCAQLPDLEHTNTLNASASSVMDQICEDIVGYSQLLKTLLLQQFPAPVSSNKELVPVLTWIRGETTKNLAVDTERAVVVAEMSCSEVMLLVGPFKFSQLQ